MLGLCLSHQVKDAGESCWVWRPIALECFTSTLVICSSHWGWLNDNYLLGIVHEQFNIQDIPGISVKEMVWKAYTHTREQSNGLLAKMTLIQGAGTFLGTLGFITIGAVFCFKILLGDFRRVRFKLRHWGNPVVFTLLRTLACQEDNF